MKNLRKKTAFMLLKFPIKGDRPRCDSCTAPLTLQKQPDTQFLLLLNSPPSLPPFCALPGVTVSPYLLAKTTQPTQKTFPLKLPRLFLPSADITAPPISFFFWGEGGREGKNGKKKEKKKGLKVVKMFKKGFFFFFLLNSLHLIMTFYMSDGEKKKKERERRRGGRKLGYMVS